MLEGEHPLSIIYPLHKDRGYVRETGSTTVALNYIAKNVFDLHKKTVNFTFDDISSNIGQNLMIYGPLIRQSHIVLYEGDNMDNSRLWSLVEEY